MDIHSTAKCRETIRSGYQECQRGASGRRSAPWCSSSNASEPNGSAWRCRDEAMCLVPVTLADTCPLRLPSTTALHADW